MIVNRLIRLGMDLSTTWFQMVAAAIPDADENISRLPTQLRMDEVKLTHGHAVTRDERG